MFRSYLSRLHKAAFGSDSLLLEIDDLRRHRRDESDSLPLDEVYISQQMLHVLFCALSELTATFE